VRGLPGHVLDLIRPHPEVLAGAVSELAEQLRFVLDALHAAIGAGPQHPVHRDLHPRQLIVAGDAVVLLDWDLAAQGDPALDVGNLRAWAQHRQPAVAPAATAAFERGYAQVGDPDVLGKAAAYTAFTQLRLAVKRYRLDGPAALPIVRSLLDAATALLDPERSDVLV
jgi:aminoglycoside phosphotransferase (APT) family kinase protein